MKEIVLVLFLSHLHCFSQTTLRDSLDPVLLNLKLDDNDTINTSNFIVKSIKSVESIEDALNATFTFETEEGIATGFLIGKSNLITNFHIVENKGSIIGVSGTGSKVKFTLIDYSEHSDIALLKCDTSFNLSFKLVDSPIVSCELAEAIVLIGTPLSMSLEHSISSGIIAGVRRINNQTYFQTDATVNLGNSGGPMLNENWEVVGVVMAKLTGLGIEGIGFALEMNDVIEMLHFKMD